MDNIRAAITGIRNGLPASGGYVYRGTGHDIMPWAVVREDGPPVSDETAGFPAPRAHRSYGAVNRCGACGYSVKGKNHQALCS